ncbi:MAG: hypothetical protein H0X65_08800 [Gemmatimonadetes bacterium]|nr:hypothetical protein [Gemmatimonadota bacterium]
MKEPMHDPSPDPELRQALGSLSSSPPAEVDWVRMRQSVRERAELPLARRRLRRKVAGWARPILPVAAAAGLALLIAIRGVAPGDESPEVAIASPQGFHPVVEEVLGIVLSEAEFDLLFGDVSADLLVVAAVDHP